MARHTTLGGCLATAAIAALSLSLPVLATPKIAQLSAKVVAPSNDQLKPASPNAISNHVLSLEKVSRPKGSSKLLRGLARQYGATHIDDLFDYEFIATIEWNGTPVKVIVDSGSSDTWLVHAGFQCVDVNGTSVPVRLSLLLFLVAAAKEYERANLLPFFIGGQLYIWSAVQGQLPARHPSRPKLQHLLRRRRVRVRRFRP
ncbi:hypothetical protein NQ176_g11345 [Zarea fungicola]|uniref:Uncharacterized protein n=1 Tax=Zarea fungicola TaxID=93591 RepID=A0ACC1MBQ5_9HYPO|nr:hypothetical protein NQ176_g11345 [Lecanicillium fungicola]